MDPRATVIIAAWNAARILPRSIAAARAQIGAHVDIVVVDDASRDDTAAVARAAPDVTLLRMEQNAGPAAARNRALDIAAGDWIAVLDADDTMRPDRIAGMIVQGEAAHADIVLGNFIRVDADETPIDPEPFLAPAGIDPMQTLTLEHYVAANAMAPGSRNLGYLKPVFRRAFLHDHAIRYDETLRNSEDYHIILAALAAGARIVIAPRPDYLYRVAPGSISHRVAPDLIARLIEADDRFEVGFGDAASPALRRLLARRRRRLADMMHGEIVLAALKERQFARAARMLGARPRTALRVLRQIREAVANRLRRGG